MEVETQKANAVLRDEIIEYRTKLQNMEEEKEIADKARLLAEGTLIQIHSL